MRCMIDNFDGMAWPNAYPEMGDLENRLRFGEAQEGDAMMAATIIAAYRELLTCRAGKRAAIVRALREKRS